MWNSRIQPERASSVERTLAAQALLAAIAERGADAVGYAYRAPGGPSRSTSSAPGASALLDGSSSRRARPRCSSTSATTPRAIPRIEANNHPIRHGAVVGVHNGIIFNDDELIDAHGFERAEPEMTVDSEAIFALAEESDRACRRRSRSCAARWRPPGSTSAGPARLPRPRRRPAALDRQPAATRLFFASTKAALEVVERYLDLKLRKREVGEGTLVVAAERRAEVERERFRPNRDFRGAASCRPCAPRRRRRFCLDALAALAALTLF